MAKINSVVNFEKPVSAGVREIHKRYDEEIEARNREYEREGALLKAKWDAEIGAEERRGQAELDAIRESWNSDEIRSHNAALEAARHRLAELETRDKELQAEYDAKTKRVQKDIGAKIASLQQSAQKEIDSLHRGLRDHGIWIKGRRSRAIEEYERSNPARAPRAHDNR